MKKQHSSLSAGLFERNLALDADLYCRCIENHPTVRQSDGQTYASRLMFAAMDWAAVVLEILQKPEKDERKKIELHRQWEKVVAAQSALIEGRLRLNGEQQLAPQILIGERQALREALMAAMKSICESTNEPKIHQHAAALRHSLIPTHGNA
jgi:hypothetical protein